MRGVRERVESFGGSEVLPESWRASEEVVRKTVRKVLEVISGQRKERRKPVGAVRKYKTVSRERRSGIF